LPVLTEETIKGASLIEDSQVFAAILSPLRIGKPGIAGASSARADPISYTVGRQRIIVPTDITLGGSGTYKLISFIDAQSTIASTTYPNAALVGTKTTR